MDLMFMLNALRKKKWVIIICTITGLIAGLVFAFVQDKVYLSAAQYSTGFTMKQSVTIKEEQGGFSAVEVDQRFSNVIETFKSPKVIGMLSYGLMLHDLEEKIPFRKLTDKQKEKEEFKAVNLDKAKQILRRKISDLELLSTYNDEEEKILKLIRLYKYNTVALLEQLTIERVERTDYLNILFMAENNELAAYVVNTIGKEFIRFYNSINTVRTGESLAKIDSLTSAKKKEVDDLTERMRLFRDQQGADPKEAQTAAINFTTELNSRLTDANTKIVQLTYSLNSINAQLNNLKSDPVKVQATTSAAGEIIQLQTMQRELIKQQAAKATEDPDIAAKLKDISQKLAALGGRAGTSTPVTNTTDIAKTREELLKKRYDTEAELEAAKTNASDLRNQVDRYTGLSRAGGGADVTAKALEGDLTIATKEYESLKAKLEMSQNISNVAPDINFKQTLMGQPAIKPESGHKVLILAIAGIACLILSMLTIVILDFLDTSMRAPSVFQKTTKLKLLTGVNKIDVKKEPVSEVFNFVDGEPKKADEQIFIENIRKLRFEIENSGKKVILFTSTKPQEGKSLVIESLANSFSLSKKKVLLIDTNFTNNSLTEKFGAKPVLEQFSANGDGKVLDKFWGITSMTKIPNIDIVGCKEGNFSPSEILPKDNLLDNLNVIAPQYDFVLMEGSALNDHADSKELAKYADGIVAVFSAKSVIKQPDKESIHFLKTNGNRFVGAVLNNIEPDNLDL